MGNEYIRELNDVPPLTAEYLATCEQNARRFQATWDQGTSGVLAAHVMRLLRERSRLVGELEELRARHEERLQYWRQPHD